MRIKSTGTARSFISAYFIADFTYMSSQVNHCHPLGVNTY